MFLLAPVMSSMAMFFHASVLLSSPFQAIWHCVPCLKESPGPGSVGVTMAWESSALDEARRAVKTTEVNMVWVGTK
jgi:hypothetical protein